MAPNWSAARSGVLGDTGAVNHASQIDQFLGAHSATAIYQGTPVLAPTGGIGDGFQDPSLYWTWQFDANDFDQPFTLSGTTVGRVEIPILPVGTGADLVVSLCVDSSGNPGAPVVTTRVPAAWITSFASVAGVAGPDIAVKLVNTSGPLAVPYFNALISGSGTTTEWAAPAAGTSTASTPSSATSGNYFIQVGGFVSGNSGPALTSVFTINWPGDIALAQPVPQPSLPQATGYGAVAVTGDTLICAGGVNSGAVTSNVYAAGWNPATGQVSAWSQQASLPQALYGAYAAARGNTVYVAGGIDGSGAILNTVYWATITNGQLQSWNTVVLPRAVTGSFVAVVGNFLVIAGGFTTAYTATTSAVYYAAINSDGSLGAWQSGPAMPIACGQSLNSLAVTNTGLAIVGGNTGSGFTFEIQSLTFGPSGPGRWQQIGGGGIGDNGFVSVSPGQWRRFTIISASSYYIYSDTYTTPCISVPLPANGLANGATYHIVMQQYGGDLNNYLLSTAQTNLGGMPAYSDLLARARGTSTWSTASVAQVIPLSVYDASASGQPWHLWQDSGARISTLVYNATPDARLLGIAEATTQPGPVLNANPTFAIGTALWSATGGTLAQSSAFTHGNLPFSGRITPTGSAASSYIESEKIAVVQGHNYSATAWLYSPTGYSSCAVNINWYNSSSTFLSATSGTVTALAAGTWTQIVTSTSGGIPANAAYGTIVAIETGTPPSSAVLYVSAATLQDASGPPLASVTQVNYASTTVGQFPTSISQLA